MKIYIFSTGYAEYEIDGYNEWDALQNLRHEFGDEIADQAVLLDVEFYSDGDDEYEDGIVHTDSEH